jgi:hypothetical protein
MVQRIIAVAAILAATGCLAACALLWHGLNQQERHHDGLITLLSRLEQREAPWPADQRPATSSDWRPLQVNLITDRGRPVRAWVTAQGSAIGGGKISVDVQTDERGIADFGPLPAGEYRATCVLDESKLSTSKSFLLGPGRPDQFEIKCPEGPPGRFDLVFDVQPPESLKEVPLYYLAHVDDRFLKHEGNAWNVPPAAQDVVLLLDSQGVAVGQTAYDKITVQESVGGGPGYSISFLDNVPQSFPLDAPTPLLAYGSIIEIWPLVRDPEAADVAARPALKRLTGAALREGHVIEPTPGRTLTVTVDASKTGFWKDVVKDLRRIPKYEGTDFAVTSAKSR